MMDYNEYHFTREEWIRNVGISVGATSLLAYLFYQSIIAVILGLPISVIIVKRRKQQLIQARYWKLNVEFKEAILSMSAAMGAGYSIENAITEAIKDLQLLLGEGSYMIAELEYMRQQIYLNRTVEEVFQELGTRVVLEDVHNFIDVFSTAKRTGGNIIKIIQSTSKSIGDKIEVKREIETVITAKKFEATIMCVVPLGIILYMWISSPGYMAPLYHNVVGIFIMTVLLVLYLCAFTLSQKIMNIEV